MSNELQIKWLKGRMLYWWFFECTCAGAETAIMAKCTHLFFGNGELLTHFERSL